MSTMAMVGFAVGGPAIADPYQLRFEDVAEGVFVAIRPDPAHTPVEGNVTVVINEGDVVVVDASGAPLAAERVIAEIRRRTPLPVRYLVNTHWHGDHHLGNQVYEREYAGVEVLAHQNTREDVSGPPMRYVAEERPSLLRRLPELQEMLDSGRRADGTVLSEASRDRIARAVEDIPVMVRELERLKITLPTATFQERLTFHRGERTIDVRWLGRGNTRGDAVVHLPRERLLIAGDLVVLPIPYAFGSYPSEWKDTLRDLLDLDFDRLVPGHGPVQTDRRYVEDLIELLRSVVDQTTALVEGGADLETVRDRIDLVAFERRFANGDARLESLFRAWFVEPITDSAFREASGQPIVQGD